MLTKETGTFNFRKFKKLKKDVNGFLNEKYGKTLKEFFPNKKTRENIYKIILGFNLTTNIFQTDNYNYELKLDSKTENIVNEIKKYINNKL